MDISYKIIIYSDWHCGSGLTAGADVDALAIKDNNILPYIPGKTIKGLMREAMEDLYSYENTQTPAIDNKPRRILFNNSFGYFANNPNEIIRGEAFFTNAELEEEIQNKIITNKIQNYLYRSIASTAIENGIAKDNSLHRIQTTVPCILYGAIKNIPIELTNDIEKALKYIKRLGVNRNRGLGRCDIKLIKKEEKGGNA